VEIESLPLASDLDRLAENFRNQHHCFDHSHLEALLTMAAAAVAAAAETL